MDVLADDRSVSQTDSGGWRYVDREAEVRREDDRCPQRSRRRLEEVTARPSQNPNSRLGSIPDEQSPERAPAHARLSLAGKYSLSHKSMSLGLGDT